MPDVNLSNIIDLVALKAARLAAIANEMPEEYFEKGDRHYEQVLRLRHAALNNESPASHALHEKLLKLAAANDTHSAATRRKKACTVIASQLCAKYNIKDIDEVLIEIVDMCGVYGSKMLVAQMSQFLDEPRDPNIRNVVSVLKVRLRKAAMTKAINQYGQ